MSECFFVPWQEAAEACKEELSNQRNVVQNVVSVRVLLWYIVTFQCHLNNSFLFFRCKCFNIYFQVICLCGPVYCLHTWLRNIPFYDLFQIEASLHFKKGNFISLNKKVHNFPVTSKYKHLTCEKLSKIWFKRDTTLFSPHRVPSLVNEEKRLIPAVSLPKLPAVMFLPCEWDRNESNLSHSYKHAWVHTCTPTPLFYYFSVICTFFPHKHSLISLQH